MPEYYYGIFISNTKYNNPDNLNDRTTKHFINNTQTSLIDKLNNVLKSHFNNTDYTCNIDHLMLFDGGYYMQKKTYKILFVRSLAEIKHPLFLSMNEVNKVLKATDCKVTSRLVYDSFPSVRFNKLYTGKYFDLDHDNKLVFGANAENSHFAVEKIN
jgi:hypothetical protein